MTAKRIELTVPAGETGLRLDQFLAGPLGSRAHAQQLIEGRRVRVNGRPRPKRALVQAGDLVEVDDTPSWTAEPERSEAPFAVVYEDEHLVVVDKPAGVVVHPARGHSTGTLAQALGNRITGGDEPWRAGIVHRLDRDTSGLLVVAKSNASHRTLKSLLGARRLRREYLALVDGHPSARSGTIDAPIGRDRRDRLKISIDTDHPRAARTHFEIERLLPSSALLRVVLETGRTHQIRAHMSAIGHPVSGDPLYGGSARFGLTRQFLHAQRLTFEHPITGEPLDLRSALPNDLLQALRRAEREPSA